MYIGEWFDRQFPSLSNGLRPSNYVGRSWSEIGEDWMRLNGLIEGYTPEDERHGI